MRQLSDKRQFHDAEVLAINNKSKEGYFLRKEEFIWQHIKRRI